MTRLVVIGAGPAGLSAAVEAAKHDVSVTVVDEGPRPGGRLLGQLHHEPGKGWWIGQTVAAELTEQASRSGVDIRTGRQVWGIERADRADTTQPRWSIAMDRSHRLHADCVVVATGAIETPIPVRGWTLPGVMAIGAAQTLTNVYRVRPGARAAVIGVDPLALTVAQEMQQGGVHVAGVYAPQADVVTGTGGAAATNIASLSRLAALAPTRMLRTSGRAARNATVQQIAARMYPARGLPVWGTRLHLRQAVTAILGSHRVEAIQTRRTDRYGRPIGRPTTSPVDCVCISGGLTPLLELPSCGARAHIAELGGEVPLTGPVLQGSEPGMFFAGNVTGVEGATVAIAQGRVAGLGASVWLGTLTGDAPELRDAQRAVQQARDDAAITFLPHIRTGRARLAEMWSAHETTAA